MLGAFPSPTGKEIRRRRSRSKQKIRLWKRPENEKAAEVSLGGLARAIGSFARLAAPASRIRARVLAARGRQTVLRLRVARHDSGKVNLGAPTVKHLFARLLERARDAMQ